MSKPIKITVHKGFVQVDFLPNFEIIDQRGELLSVFDNEEYVSDFAKRKKAYIINPDEFIIKFIDENERLNQVRINYSRFWCDFTLPGSFDYIIDTASKLFSENLFEKVNVEYYSRIGIRSLIFIPFKEEKESIDRITPLINMDCDVFGSEKKGGAVFWEIKDKDSNITTRINLVTAKTIKENMSEREKIELPEKAILIDVDYYITESESIKRKSISKLMNNIKYFHNSNFEKFIEINLKGEQK